MVGIYFVSSKKSVADKGERERERAENGFERNFALRWHGDYLAGFCGQLGNA